MSRWGQDGVQLQSENRHTDVKRGRDRCWFKFPVSAPMLFITPSDWASILQHMKFLTLSQTNQNL